MLQKKAQLSLHNPFTLGDLENTAHFMVSLCWYIDMSRNTHLKLEISVQLFELGYNNLEIIPIVKKLSAHAKDGENLA